MGNDKNKSRSVTSGLRSRAEERLKADAPEAHPPRTEQEIQRLFHELQVHQIELEMQNAELRRAREEVETVLEEYTELYDFAPVGYFTLDRNGDIRRVNLTGASLLGVERSRLTGRRFGQFVAEEFRPFFAEFLGKVFGSQGKESCDVTLPTRGGLPLVVQIEAVAAASGQVCCIAMIDITDRKRAEEALFNSEHELEDLNRFLEIRIGEAVDELRRKDQMLILRERQALMGEMINNIAHQWRQPLNTLGLIIQQLPLFYGSDRFNRQFLDENAAKAMMLIQHMSETIDGFKNFFRADKETVAFSVNQVIAHTLSLIEDGFREQMINISFCPEGDPTLTGYPNEYAQVVLNILMNARDALVERNVVDARISLRAFTEEGKSVVTIGDNAGGIAEEIMDRLFDPYFTTKEPDKGTGIGLFMSKTIIEKNMSGSLTVCNTGEGAEFRIEV